MNTAARFWLLLVASYTVAHSLIFVLLWRTIDLRLEVVAQHAAIPILQATALAWVVGGFSLTNYAQAAVQAVSRPLVAVMWCAEGALLFAYWGLESGTDLTGLVARTAGLESLLAAVIILIQLFLFPSASFRTWVAILPFALLMLVLGTNGLKPWFNHLPSWLPEGWPLLLRQMLVLGATVISLIVFTGKAQKALSTRSPLAGLILGWLQLFFIVAAMALVMNGYLYAFLVSPWRQVITTSLSLAATCLLTAALCLPWMWNSDQRKIFPPLQIPLRPMGLRGSWFVLTICCFACVLILRALFFPHWDWSAQTLLTFSLIPFMQASWLRWFQELGKGWRSGARLSRKQTLFLSLMLLEVSVFGYMAFSRNFWEIPGFLIIASAWVGLKLVILGAAILKEAFQGTVRRKFLGICGAGAFVLGVGTAFNAESSAWTWMIPVFGSAFLLMGLWWRPKTSVGAARLAGATAEALLIPLLSMAFCVLVLQNQPMALLRHGTYTMVAVATTLLAMVLISQSQEIECGP